MHFLDLRIPPPLVALIIGCGMWFLAKVGPILALPGSVRVLTAVIFGLAGLGCAIGGVVSFRRARTTISPLKPETATELVSSGIYAVTRNPMYLGMLLVLVGWALYLLSTAALIGPVAFWLYIDRFQIVPEEKALAKLFGAEFSAYLRKVRRWL